LLPSPSATSSLLLVVDVPDDVGDVLVAFLLLFDESGVVQSLVFELDLVLGAFDRLAIGGLLTLGFGVRVLERNKFGLCGLREPQPLLPARVLPLVQRQSPVASVSSPRELQNRVAFRADNRIFAEIVEFRAAIAAEALSAELGFRHGPGSSRGSKMRCFTWRVAVPVSIAPEQLPAARASGHSGPDDACVASC
jgi:hypothetical protein